MWKKVKIMAIVFVLLFMTILNESISQKGFADNSISAWVVSGMERVGQEDPSWTVKDIQIYAARGEYESFQVIIKAPQDGLSIQSFSVSNLFGSDSQVINNSNFSLYREHYAHIAKKSDDWHGSNRPLSGNLFPDALIPFIDPATGQPPSGKEATLKAVPYTLAESKNQPFWVDLFVPRDAKPDQYIGTYTVTTDKGIITGQVNLTVWDFELPLQPSLRSSFLFWTDWNNKSSNKS